MQVEHLLPARSASPSGCQLLTDTAVDEVVPLGGGSSRRVGVLGDEQLDLLVRLGAEAGGSSRSRRAAPLSYSGLTCDA